MSFQICDIECYQNYFLLLILDPINGTIYRWERFNDIEIGRTHDELRDKLKPNRTVTFNGLGYDFWMVSAYLDGHDNAGMKDISDYLILTKQATWSVTREKKIEIYHTKHLDIMPIAPLIASLKIYAGRLHAPKLQDLPIHPSRVIDESARDTLVEYCINDCHATLILFNYLKPQIKLRYEMQAQYKLTLSSKSDAQIAEAVVRSMLKKKGITPPKKYTGAKTFKYEPPECIQFSTSVLQRALKRVTGASYELSSKGVLLCPPELREPIEFKNCRYKMGIGGLHTTEKGLSIDIRKGEYLTDLDVTSYYPSLILNNRLYPESLGEGFLEVYRTIVEERIAAKSMVVKLSLKIKRLERELRDFEKREVETDGGV